MAIDYQIVKKIFLEALEKPSPQERHQFVLDACATDAELRDFVLGMLEAHEKVASPIPEAVIPDGPTRFDPDAHAAIKLPPALQPGSILAGRYKIIELIADGGMGSVYRAARISELKMEVAIKVIKPGMDSQQVLARFNIERQALALMKHENIARVLDAGTTDQNLPFFVMELVKGLSLTRYCDENKLPVPERLALFEKVCEAVQHAHQKGIVHRDLKPSNILVALFDDKAVPKIIDFGLAKALHQPLTDDLHLTRFNTFVGTWQYTAPEQAQVNNLDIDTRADIYSLGVILYELLTGSTPVEKNRLTNAAYLEVLRMIREEEPPKPSTKIHSSEQLPSIAALRRSEPLKLEKMIRGELDWIVMKALEKDRNRRYATANDLAKDLNKFRNHEPVEAGPPSFTYKLSKYVHRHRGKVLTAGLLLSIIVVGAIVSTIGWITATRERTRANQNAEIARAVSDFLREDLLSEADPGVQIKPNQNFISNITVVKALDRAAEKVGTRFKDKPVIEAAVRHTIGKTYLGLGDIQKAKKQLEIAEQLRLKIAGANDADRLESLYELGWVQLLDSKLQLAESALKETAKRREAAFGPTNPSTLKSKYALGLLLRYQDKHEDAKRIYETVLQEQKRQLTLSHHDTLVTQRELAALLQHLGKIKQAEVLLDEVYRTQQEVLGKSHPETLTTMNSLALLLDEKKEYLQAEKMITEVIERSEQVLGKDNPKYLAYLINLAGIYQSQEKYKPAIELLKGLIPKMKQILGPVAFDTLGAIQNLAGILSLNGQDMDAEPLFVEAYQGCRKTLGEKNEYTRMVLANLVEVYRKLKKPDKVKEYEQELARLSR